MGINILDADPYFNFKHNIMPKGFMYILKCSDDTYYIGSTIDLLKRFLEHQSGTGAN